jgi:hypothetical protein
MYQMKKGGSKQQAAIAIAMKAKGKKPKMSKGGPVKKYQIGGTQTPFEYRVDGPKVGPIQVKQNNVPGAQEARRTADFNTEQGDINRAKRASDRREMERANTPIEKGSSSPRPLTNSVKNFVRSEMKKGGMVGTSKKTKMKMGGSLKDVPADKVGLGKLPTAVRNKMGYKEYGGSTKMKMGGTMKKTSKKKK